MLRFVQMLPVFDADNPCLAQLAYDDFCRAGAYAVRSSAPCAVYPDEKGRPGHNTSGRVSRRRQGSAE